MKTRFLLASLMLSLPLAATAAEDLSYNYVEADYLRGEITGAKTSGWGVKGSFAFHPNFHVFAGYQKRNFKTPSNLGINEFNLGVGFNYEIAKNTDLLTRVSYQQLDDKFFSNDFKGWAAEAGINHAFGPSVSTYFLAGFEDYGKMGKLNPKGQFFGRLGAQYNINKNFAISGEIKKYASKGDMQWSIGPRISW